jgi:acyl-coenzyme A synthetase/AMP-(fatty) acid ligase
MEIFLVDKISEFLRSVSPVESIEHILGTHPAVVHMAIEIPHPINGHHPMTVVSLVLGKMLRIVNPFDYRAKRRINYTISIIFQIHMLASRTLDY